MTMPEHVIHDVVQDQSTLRRFAQGDFNKYDLYAISQILMHQPTADDLANVQVAAIKELGK